MTSRDSSAGPSGHRAPKAATVEDYTSDEDGDQPEAASQANSQARRTPLSSQLDLGSDSGYSSHHPATAPPSDSTGPTPATRAPTAARSVPEIPPSRRRPAIPHSRTFAAPQPSRHPSAEPAAATDLRRMGATVAGPAPRPYADCVPSAFASRGRSGASPLESPWNLNHPPFEHAGRPAVDAAPPMPARRREPEEMVSGAAAHAPRPRVLKSYSNRTVRPMSYHEGVAYSSSYVVGVPDARLDARLFSAHPALANPGNAAASYPLPHNMPPPASHRPAPHLPPRPQQHPYPGGPLPFADTRPPPQRWYAEPPYAVRPGSMYGPPLVVNYGAVATSMPMVEGPPRRGRRPSHGDYQRMPPPPPPPHPAATAAPPPRPSVRNSASFGRERSRPRSHRRSDDDPTAMAPSMSRSRSNRDEHDDGSLPRRPNISVARADKKAAAEYLRAHESMEAALAEKAADKRRRRANYYGYEDGGRDYSRSARDPREYDSRTSSATSEAPPPPHARSGAASRPGSEIFYSGGRESADGHGHGQARGRPPSGIAVSMPKNEEGVTMRFAAGAGVRLDFTGGFEGRTVSLKPGHDGEQAELCIGTRRSQGQLQGSSTAALEYGGGGNGSGGGSGGGGGGSGSGSRRREIEDSATTVAPGLSRSGTQSRRHSRAPSRRQPLL
ncbi:MAG: hypothetical protein M1826_001200 [Phylliscum demangeonii]|nr:MAG: hypothetical protein M1826_001200 [Phylliscum demangeonii]